MYYQVAQQLEQAIETGELAPGARLDGELALANQLGVSRPTLRRAIEYLVDRGYLVRRRAVGTQVVHPKVRRPVELTSLYDDLTARRKNPRTTVLSLDKVPATDAVAHALGLEDGVECWPSSGSATPTASRWRSCATGSPSGWSSWTPAARAGRAVPAHAGRRDQPAPRLPDHRGQGGQWRRGQAAPGPQGRAAADHVAHHLQRNGQPVELADHLYRASLYSFEIVLVTR